MSNSEDTTDAEQRIAKALSYATWGAEEGEHHKAWTIDQMVRALTGCPMIAEEQGESEEYRRFRSERADGGWDEGIAP